MTTRHHLAGLDAIRFLAATLVVIYHFFFTFWASESFGNSLTRAALFAPPQAQFTWFGWIGVQIFFVLSGVVISYSASQSSAAKFLRDRVVRLAPMAWVSAAMGFVVLIAAGHDGMDTFGEFAREITFFPLGPWIDKAFWTIGVEISFYALVFAMLAAGKFRYFERLAAIIGMVSTTYVCLVIATCSNGAAPCTASQRFPRLMLLLLLEHGCFFAIGVVIWKRRIARRRDDADWLFLPSLIGCIAQIVAHNTQEIARYDGDEIGVAQPWAVPVVIWIVAIGLIILACHAKPAPPRVSALLRSAGLATYPLYLMHANLGSAVIAFCYLHGMSLTLSVAAGAVLCVVLSFFLAVLVEPRIQTSLRDVLQRFVPRKPAQVETPMV